MDNKFYDESIYLDSKNNDEAIKYFDKANREFISSVRNNALRYGSNIQSYNDLINLVSYLVKVMSIPNNSINSSIILNTIINKGIVSNNKSITLTNNIKNDIVGFLGINVVKGNASCRHLTAFHSDVFSKINLMSEPLYCYITDKDLENANDFAANHVINLIEYKGNLCGYDLTNNKLFKFTHDGKMIEMFSDNPLYIYYKPYIEVMLGEMKVENASNMFKLFDEFKDKDIISLEEYKYILYWAKSITSKNESLLRDFHESSKKYIKKITNGLK